MPAIPIPMVSIPRLEARRQLVLGMIAQGSLSWNTGPIPTLTPNAPPPQKLGVGHWQKAGQQGVPPFIMFPVLQDESLWPWVPWNLGQNIRDES